MRSWENPERRLNGSVERAQEEIQLGGWVRRKSGPSIFVVPPHLRSPANGNRNIRFEHGPEVGKGLFTLVVALSPGPPDGVFGGIAVQEWCGRKTEMEEQPELDAGGGVGNVNAFISRQLQSGAQVMVKVGYIGVE
jgi:hypothetical protein